jgi:hypothetical protein
MPWCPSCRVEYREGYTLCTECQVALVETRPGEAAPDVLVEVGAFASLEAAEMAQGLLEANDIPTEVEDARVPNPELGPAANGEVALLVPREHAELARVLLSEADRGELADGAEAAAEAPAGTGSES